MTKLDDRERRIVKLASGILDRVEEFDEATIDANFIFRFEPDWCRWVANIRAMMREMLGRNGDESLSNEDAARWKLHIDYNSGVYVEILTNESDVRYLIHTESGGYRCLNKSLKEQSQIKFRQLTNPSYREDRQRIQMEIWYEANQTSKILSEIFRLGRAYHIIPHEHEYSDYSLNDNKRMHQRLINWIIYGGVVPEFMWETTVFTESKTRNGIERIIRLFEAPKGYWQPANGNKDKEKKGIEYEQVETIIGISLNKEFSQEVSLKPKPESSRMVWIEKKPLSNKRIMVKTRVRTWVIYFLTKRGGGQRTEQNAVDIWNEYFPNLFVSKTNYQTNRQLLLKSGSKKTLR